MFLLYQLSLGNARLVSLEKIGVLPGNSARIRKDVRRNAKIWYNETLDFE